jgi:hypothetical protein
VREAFIGNLVAATQDESLTKQDGRIEVVEVVEVVYILYPIPYTLYILYPILYI